MRKLISLLFAVLLLLSLASCHRVSGDELRVVVRDVGQGDAVLLSQGDAHILVDAGSSASRDALVAQLYALGIEHLEYMVITHPHEDHFGNARTVLERCHVDTLLVSDEPEGDGAYHDALSAARERGTNIKKVADGYRFSLGEAICSLVKPLAESKEENDASLAMRVVFGKTTFLLMSDVEAAGESALIAEHGASFLDADWIKIGHHGAADSTKDALLDVVTPRYAAISCAAYNEYGFPDEELLSRLEKRGVTVYRTDTMGALCFTSDGKEITYGT